MYVFLDAIYFALKDQQDSYVDHIHMKHVKAAFMKSLTSVQANDAGTKVNKEKPSLVHCKHFPES
jgi:hypothetical protein